MAAIAALFTGSWSVTSVLAGAAAPALPVRLDISPGPPAGTTEARLIFDLADGVRGFELLLQFEPGRLLSASTDNFRWARISPLKLVA